MPKFLAFFYSLVNIEPALVYVIALELHAGIYDQVKKIIDTIQQTQMLLIHCPVPVYSLINTWKMETAKTDSWYSCEIVLFVFH